MSAIKITEANLSNPEHADAITQITNEYAKDPMGINRELDEEVKSRLISEMNLFPCMINFIAYSEGKAVGLANCFFGFSTFNAKKLLNIHDLIVLPGERSRGIGEKLLRAVEDKAHETDCCKVVLEVREDNRAKNLYERFGFTYGEPLMYFMTKELE